MTTLIVEYSDGTVDDDDGAVDATAGCILAALPLVDMTPPTADLDADLSLITERVSACLTSSSLSSLPASF